MNKIFNIGLWLVLVVFFSGCDYVINPLLPRTVIKTNDSIFYQNILVEDYNGMTCENCPSAASEVDTLISLYGSRIIPLSVNYGYYATPPLASPYNGWDFTTAVGNDYGNLFITQSSSFPAGMINRLHVPQGLNNMGYAQWGDTVKNIINANTGPAPIKLVLTTAYNVSSRVLTTAATVTFLKAYSGNYNIVLLLTQDSINAPQNVAGTLNSNYKHRFVLRDKITTSDWGDILVSGSATANQVFTTQTYSYTLNAGYPQSPGSGCSQIPCDYTKCSVVAYIYDAATSSSTHYQVMQAQQKKIYP